MFPDIHTHQPHADGTSICNVEITAARCELPVSGYLSVGIHPCYIEEDRLDSQLDNLRIAAADPVVKLVGECGFDARAGSEELQERVFKEHITLAHHLGKPLIIHCVRAFDRLMGTLLKQPPQVPVVIHGFNRAPELASQLTTHGWLLSFGTAILDPASNAARVLAGLATPFFLETDDSGIQIEQVYTAAAKLRRTDAEELKAVIFANWKKIGII